MAVNFRTLDLNLLRVFDEVMLQRNLTRAAENLAMTQPAVSNALRRLRDSVGDELLVRVGRGVEPTHQALQMWPAVREALDRLRDAVVPPSFDPAPAGQSFEVAMVDTTAAIVLPALVQRLAERAPGVSVRTRPLVTRDPRELLSQEAVDLAVGYFPPVLAELAQRDAMPTSISFEPLYEGRYVCVMRADHPLAARTLTLDDYCAADHLLVSLSGRAFGYIDQVLAGLARTRRVVLTVNQVFTACRVVASSDLLTVLVEHFVPATGFAGELVTRPLPFDMAKVRTDMFWHRRNQERLDHLWLRRQVAEAAGAGLRELRAAGPRQSLGWTRVSGGEERPNG